MINEYFYEVKNILFVDIEYYIFKQYLLFFSWKREIQGTHIKYPVFSLYYLRQLSKDKHSIKKDTNLIILIVMRWSHLF